MTLAINTNIGSMNAQRKLGRTNQGLAKTLGRLASGLRINSARDDAAGLAISERLNSQVRGLNQAQRNANDGISLLQTAESALTESTDILQRMRELAVQSANDTNTTADRAALQLEVDQLKEEFDRIADTTQFNGSNILDGTFANGATFQVGANAGQTINVAIQASGTTDMGQIATSTSLTGVSSAVIAGGGVETINGKNLVASQAYGATGNGRGASSAYSKAKAINASGVGVTATAEVATSTVIPDATNGLTNSGDVITLNGQTVLTASGTETVDDVVAAINVYSAETGVTASNTGTNLKLQANDGRDIILANSNTTTTGTLTSNASTTAKVTLSSGSNITLGGGIGVLLGRANDNTITLDTSTLQSVDVTTQANASNSIMRVDSALETIASRRAGMGAVGNRLETTISNLANVSENLSAARSRVLDADFAAETASLSKFQILQQSGVAALSQANSSSQIALSLLR